MAETFFLLIFVVPSLLTFVLNLKGKIYYEILNKLFEFV